MNEPIKPVKTFAKESVELELMPGGRHTVKTQLTYKGHGDVISVGTVLNVFYSKKAPGRVIFQYGSDRVKVISIDNAHKYLTGFSDIPSIKTLDRWSLNGIAKTPTGKKVEPDGYGTDNSPSWFLVLGII